MISFLIRFTVALTVLGSFLFLLALGFVRSGMPGTMSGPAECAIVFGAAVHPVFSADGSTIIDAQAGAGIARRVKAAVELYRQGKIRRLFLTGGKGDAMTASEAEVMRQVALDSGVDSSVITLETHASSTKENLRFTRPLMAGCQGIVAVSDRYHLARIRFLAHMMSWEVETYPAQKASSRAFEWKSSVREALGILLEDVTSLLT